MNLIAVGNHSENALHQLHVVAKNILIDHFQIFQYNRFVSFQEIDIFRNQSNSHVL